VRSKVITAMSLEQINRTSDKSIGMTR